MKKIGKYWVDENNNKWDRHIYSKEEAIRHSKSLINCKGCVNCRGCVGCVGCVYCKDCVNCRGCWNCRGCVGYRNYVGCRHYKKPKPNKNIIENLIGEDININ